MTIGHVAPDATRRVHRTGLPGLTVLQIVKVRICSDLGTILIIVE
jgi:hypothetical protein